MAVFFTFAPRHRSNRPMKPILVIGIAFCAIAAGSTVAGTAGPAAAGDEATIVHVLNRAGYGARPGDVDRVRTIGLRRYIDDQLHPDRVPDPAMAARLADLTTLRMSSSDIARDIERPQVEARRARKQQGANEPPPQPPPPDPVQQKANSVVVELSEQKILRAVYSERQLQEVLTDFWFNHFNVDARKGRDRFLLTEYEREAIRPHVLGRFRDLLGATAKSPAMLFYLDNWMSADPNGPHLEMRPPRVARGPFGGRVLVPATPRPQPQGKNAPKGLNENYARELMELHTLGVDGGYTQHDVTEVARAFTGWTIENPQRGAGFRFEPRRHDAGQKIVLGRAIKAGGGESDGELVLDILATHPSTARFIATKLARRFVSDTPPPELVERAARRFRDTDGDLREVTRTILISPEFLAAAARGAKVKTPFEFVASALRASGAEVEDARPLVRELQQLGMPLYMCQPPTGYADAADAWVNTGALVNRMNFALRLSSNRLPRVTVSDIGAHANTMLVEPISESTRTTIAKATDPAQIAALTLGSPEFQRR
jgi:uncharacterized protein (DUF1800 family)